ncbi:hypothetical protein GHT06_015004 [Daphnia sinensis]|uniref:Uncharacterized protein n=1 Tax=Daphnia sinensis TaxID=1820382 RepID=A0AAD5L8W4_9CRUS|nr:hypothetical protein GHT06_015004 [Daphnia sinensis]
MKGNLTEEEEASRQRVHKVLETFLAGKFKLVNCNPEIEYHTTSKITTHLFTALKNCLRHCNCEVSHQILQFLLEAIKFNGKMSSNDNMSAKTASLGLLEAYAMIFECKLIQPEEELLPDLKEVFHHLVSKHIFHLPLLVEPYIFVLVQLNLQEEAETLLQKYVDMESKGNIGITSALHALNIMKIHLPKASLKLTISLLEMIADRFSGDPKVLELCHHHMHIHSSLDKECSSDLGSDGRAAYSHKHRHLNKCLRLIIYFLDVHIFNVPSPDIKEAWKIMTNTIRGICLQGYFLILFSSTFCFTSEKCLQSIVELWYNDRQRWWPCFRFPRSGLPPTLAPDEAEFFSNKGFVCYILESDNHPFVAGLMDHGELPLLNANLTQTLSVFLELTNR